MSRFERGLSWMAINRKEDAIRDLVPRFTNERIELTVLAFKDPGLRNMYHVPYVIYVRKQLLSQIELTAGAQVSQIVIYPRFEH